MLSVIGSASNGKLFVLESSQVYQDTSLFELSHHADEKWVDDSTFLNLDLAIFNHDSTIV